MRSALRPNLQRTLILPTALLITVLLAPAAWGFCMVDTLDDQVQHADAVWWGTVTDAAASQTGAPGGEPGYWRLTVEILDVLKGPDSGPQATTVFIGSCGPNISPEGAAKMAPDFIGKTQLFYGNFTHAGGLMQSSVIVKPQGLTEQQVYRRAAAAVGVRPQAGSSPSPHLIDGGGRVANESSRLALVAIVGVVTLLLLVIWLVARTRRSRS